jgi:hypothetical protein
MLTQTRARYLQSARLSLYHLTGIGRALEIEETRTLERHMGFHGQWEEHRRFQLDFAKRIGLVPSARFIEIGCGPLTLGLPMIGYLDAGNYTGIDVRPEVLNLSWQQVGKAGLSAKNPRLVISQSFGAHELPGDARADMMWSFSVLYHLTDALVDACFAQVAHRLAPGACYIANINPVQDESTWLQFPFNRRDVGFYRGIAERHGLKLEELGTLQSLGFTLDAVEKVNILLKLQHA